MKRRNSITEDAKNMKKRYDFSKGEQGKFYHPDAILKLPIYLDDDLVAFIEEYAKEKKADLQTAVNDILRHNKEMLQALKA
jgi:hypothetical protein